MNVFFEQVISQVWNRFAGGGESPHRSGLELGHAVADGRETVRKVYLPQGKRAEHLVILGKTGSGKSVLLRNLALQDIKAGQGFVYFDLHGDATPALLRMIAAEEQRSGKDLSEKVIVIDPADREYSVGLNALEQRDSQHGFVQIAEFAQLLKIRWHLDSFGPRTEELLRNALLLLSHNHLTLLELGPVLTNYALRASLLRGTTNKEVAEYFSSRFDQASEALQAVYRDAVLNKVTAFTGDPHFRHILGQRQSTFSMVEALDHGSWVIVNLDKGRLGEQAATLGSLLLIKLKNALFSRKRRSLFTIFCDEVQNLLSFDAGLETFFSEARKFNVSISSANQFLDQQSVEVRGAMAAAGSHIYFQLSSGDALKVAGSLGGGRSIAEDLRNLPRRHLLVKIGHHRVVHAVVPQLKDPKGDYTDLLRRSEARWARSRSDIEAEIRNRHDRFRAQSREVLDEWE
jgi:DNA helicase HerA-like ATPase